MHTALINASSSAWAAAQDAMTKFAGISSKDNPDAYQQALFDLNMKMQLAATVEQKAASAIDKAFQAHSAVASK